MIAQTLHWDSGRSSTSLKVILTMLLKEGLFALYKPLITVTLSKGSQSHISQETKTAQLDF